MITDRLAITSANTFAHISPDTQKLLIVPPRKLFLGMVGELIVGNEKSLNPNHFFKVENFKINQKYLDNTEEVARLQKDVEHNHT